MRFDNLSLQVWDLQTGLVCGGRLTPINSQISLSAEIGLLLTCVVNMFSNLIQSSEVPLNGVILSPCNFDLHTFAVVSSLTFSRSSGCQLLISPPKTLFCICEADILLSQTWPYCYRMLTHSHSATSLYNWANLSQSEISLHQLFISRPHLNLRTGVVWPRVYCKFFAIFTFWLQKYLDFGLFSPFYLRYYSKVIYQLTWKLILIW